MNVIFIILKISLCSSRDKQVICYDYGVCSFSFQYKSSKLYLKIYVVFNLINNIVGFIINDKIHCIKYRVVNIIELLT